MSHEDDTLMRASLDHCVKCTICETQCPVAAVTPEFSGPKFVGPQAERFREGKSVDKSLDYCSSCGICSQVCPQGVKIAELNSIARAAMKKDHMPLRDRLISNTTLMGTMMTPVAPLANAALSMSPVRWLMEKTIGIDRDAPMPQASTQTLRGWWKNRPLPLHNITRGPIIFFHGCAATYFEQATGIATIEVLEALGYDVLLPKQGCCGLPMQSNGLFDDARGHVRKLVDALTTGVPTDVHIVACSTSCGGMLRHEAHQILGIDDEELADVGSRVVDICELLLDLVDAGEISPQDWLPYEAHLPYHPPCQLKGQGFGTPALHLLEMIPGLELEESEVACCGMAGTYGIKTEKYDIAMKVGEPLFDMVKDCGADLALCDSETCRWQIEKATDVETVHPILLVHRAMGLDAK